MIKFQSLKQNKILFSYQTQNDLNFFLHLSDKFDIYNNKNSKKILIVFEENHPLFNEISKLCKRIEFKRNLTKISIILLAIFLIFMLARKNKISKILLQNIKKSDNITFSKLIDIDKITKIILEIIFKKDDDKNEKILTLFERFKN